MKSKFLKQPAVTVFAATALLFTTSCTFTGPGVMPTTPEEINSRFSDASLAQPYAANRNTLFSDGLLEVQHGVSCAEARRAVSRDNAGNISYGIRVDESAPIPAGYDNGTVFLNGWRLKYRKKDHHVLALSTALVNIEMDVDELRWSAGGIVTDKNGDDAYSWCYYYTLLFWSNAIDFDADVMDSDAAAELTFLLLNPDNNTSALHTGFNIIERLADRPKALLPRGFGVMLSDENPIFTANDDSHLLQFSLKYGDLFAITYEDGSGSDAWWPYDVVFNDNSPRSDYNAAQLISVMLGDNVEVINPKFTIRARRPPNLNIGNRARFRETVVVDNVPFEYAVPMLTGWDLGSSRSDRHVKEIGAWIESFEYTKDPSAELGTLTYTINSVFSDKSYNGFTLDPQYQVSILGFNSDRIPGPQESPPQDLPRTPPTTDDESPPNNPPAPADPPDDEPPLPPAPGDCLRSRSRNIIPAPC